jgi:hypothetical protein
LLCCVSASGDAYSPLLIAPHPKARRIFEKGIRENIDLKLEIRQVPYMDAELFNQHIKKIFIPTVSANQELPECANKPAILFCDNCSPYYSEEILRELARNGILILTHLPHTSHLFQVIDVLLFGLLKVFKEYLPKDDNEDREIDHILRIFGACEGATTSMMIPASWEKAGFSYHQRDGTFYLVADEGRIREAQEFCEIWERNYPIESLSAQRRNQKWGWVNQQFFHVKYVSQLKGGQTGGIISSSSRNSMTI